MHPCLTIDEILRNIFGCTKERRTLCAVAQTCRTFNGPATDLIWETLTDLRPVLQLYSSVLGTSGEYENLLPCGDSTDRQKVRQLSSCVRRLHFQMMCYSPRKTFLHTFRNLRKPSLEMHSFAPLDDAEKHDDNYVVHFLRSLIHPHLSALRVNSNAARFIRLLPYFPACPRMRYLNIEGGSSPDGHELASALSEMAPVFPLLEVVRCNRVSWGVLNCLSQLDALQQLWVDLPDQIDTSYCPTIETLTFPQLRALNMVTGTLQSSLAFLRLTALDKLTDLNMSCTYIAFDGAIYDASEDIQDLLALVPSQCRQLESIRVNSGVWPLACRRTSHSETSEFWLSRPTTAPL